VAEGPPPARIDRETQDTRTGLLAGYMDGLNHVDPFHTWDALFQALMQNSGDVRTTFNP
jgi:hypothetical protein